MNPPFKGAVDKNDLHDTLQPAGTTKSELLFLHLILRALDMGGRCAVIVPDGVLFGSSRAHVELRRKLVEENRLDGVISMPCGVFKPYAGVSHGGAVLHARGARRSEIWFYDMAARRLFAGRQAPAGGGERHPRHADLLAEAQRRRPSRQARAGAAGGAESASSTPLKAERLELEAEINRLTFEQAISAGRRRRRLARRWQRPRARLEELHGAARPAAGRDTTSSARQFWVSKEQVKANKYDLSASRYRQVEADEVYYEKPEVTLERMARLEQVMEEEISKIGEMVK